MLDGIYLNFLKKELEKNFLNSRVDKIYQPSKDEIIMLFRVKNSPRLLISVKSDSARVNITNCKIENPAAPPMFCMLLRKHLINGKLINIYQKGLDRLIRLDFIVSNELGNEVKISLVIELMGRHSNAILITEDNIIIDSIKRINTNLSRVRQILPGKRYIFPPLQNKLNILERPVDDLANKIINDNGKNLSQSVMNIIEGISPIVADEIQHSVLIDDNNLALNRDKEFMLRLTDILSRIKHMILNNKGIPNMLKNLDNHPKDFSFMNIDNLSDGMIVKTYSSFSMLLEDFYFEKDSKDRIKQKTNDLLKMINNKYIKIKKKLELYNLEKLKCRDKDIFQQYGVLIQSNLNNIENGLESIELDNFFSENNDKIVIPLDNSISPLANSQRYFNKYKKLCSADKLIDKLIEESQNELIYLDTIEDSINRLSSQFDLDEIKNELYEQGYIKKIKISKNLNKVKNPKDSLGKEISCDNFVILYGHNNIQNDWLSLKHAKNHDIWFHVQKIPGAHVVIVTEGKEVPITTLEYAAVLAAKNSKSKNNNIVPVDYTRAKNVKKIKGAKPGAVIYNNFETIFVKPNCENS